MANPSPAAQVIQQSQPQPQQLLAQGGAGAFSNASLYVGDLDPTVTEGQLYDLFSQMGPVSSIRVCRDQIRRISLGYAYVNYNTPQEASNALEVLNFTPINGKPIRIMFSHRDPSIRKSGFANVFIKNLDTSIDNKALHDTFAAFGTVLSCKVATDSNGQSKGYGFVQFEQEEAAQNAIKRLNGMLINDKQVYVGLFVRRQEKDRANGSPKFTNVYVKNLSETTTDEDLKNVFGKFGPITSAVIMRDANGNSRGFGFVNFQNPDDAAAAVENLNGSTFNDDKIWYVGKAQRKSEREAELKAKYEQERIGRLEKLQGANLYLKNLDDNIDDEKLKELFAEFGNITSCKVMLDPVGQSRGSGFVAFSTPEEANRAVNEMNGKMIGRKPLYVAVAQRKEERKARLQAHFAQLRAPGAMSPAMPSSLPGFHPGAPRLAPQQLYFGQGNPGLIPPQHAGYGFQQQMLPGMRPGVAPNFLMPYPVQRQGQPGQRMGVRRGGTPQQIQQQQLMQRNANQGFRYMPNARNGVDPTMVPQGLMGPMMPLQMDVPGVPVASMDPARPQLVPITTLASALASASPDQQRLMLGEQLFPLVDRLEHDHAGKVTGMLLEMDQPEVLHLIESPDALKKKVAEAMEVLRLAQVAGTDAADQLSSLSLND
ncbi:polyadenylate-binding protein 3 [Magnolia sinica]|uniref:polyadenylate-binding protein 3 n=1 Tax=Magnolia sinica TaxID=86752 RepID=UPI002657C178|nr:polyadenylate-binding protein 3 [Magnolia sinica]XP_058111022.1 polyadenylate-binding protein 3 [Magnolia sinica]